MYLDPSTVRWRDAPSGVTFVGDAAHPMSPYLGRGANTAMRTAAILIEQGRDAFLDALAARDGIAAAAVMRSRERTEFDHSAQCSGGGHHGWAVR